MRIKYKRKKKGLFSPYSKSLVFSLCFQFIFKLILTVELIVKVVLDYTYESFYCLLVVTLIFVLLIPSQNKINFL